MTKVATADAGALSTEHVMYTAVATAAAAAADDDKEDALVPSTNSRVCSQTHYLHQASFRDGGLRRLREADEAAVDWLTTYGS